MIYYCSKCGRVSISYSNEPNHSCDCCNNPLRLVPKELYNSESDFIGRDNPLVKDLREKYVKTSPEFDQYLYDHREEILADKHKKNEQIIEMAKAATAKPKVECPYCHSTDTTKISAASKAGSVFFFGLFSQKVKHQWHCNKCGSDF